MNNNLIEMILKIGIYTLQGKVIRGKCRQEILKLCHIVYVESKTVLHETREGSKQYND